MKNKDLRTVEVWLRGGLGNQLFQYAFARSLKERSDCELIIRGDLLPKLDDVFNGHSRWAEQISTFRHAGRLLSKRHQPTSGTHLISKILTTQRIASDLAPSTMARLGVIAGNRFLNWDVTSRRLEGHKRLSLNNYFHDMRPIKAIHNILRDEIRDVANPSKEMQSEVSHVKEKMGIHIRLGDHVQMKTNLIERYVDTLKSAVAQLEMSKLNPNFALFSDDVNLAMDILDKAGLSGDRVAPVRDQGLRPIETLHLLSSCSGLVATPSTFAWWGAFLQDRREYPIMFKSPWTNDPRDAPSDKIFLPEWKLLPRPY